MITRSLEGHDFKTRAEDGNLYIEGYFSVFNSRYDLWEGAYETIDVGAFDLATDTDVRALADHDTRIVLGRTTAGTLTLRVDERGLWGSILVNQADTEAMNLYERVKRGDVNQCSFGFDVLDSVFEREGGFDVWHIRRVKLYEVSVVTFPAYTDTSAQARKSEDEHILRCKAEVEEIKKRAIEAWRESAREKLKGAM